MGDNDAWKAEQRYRAVLEVTSGSPVSEVAQRYGVSRQTIFTWRRRYTEDGVNGLQEGSHRASPNSPPARRRPGSADLRVTPRAPALGVPDESAMNSAGAVSNESPPAPPCIVSYSATA